MSLTHERLLILFESARDERLRTHVPLAVAACDVVSSGPLPRLAEGADRAPAGGAHAARLKRGVGREATHAGWRQRRTNVEHLDERLAVAAHLALVVDVLGAQAEVVPLVLELVEGYPPPGAGHLLPRRESGEPLVEELLDLSPDQLLGMREGAEGQPIDSVASAGKRARGTGMGGGGSSSGESQPQRTHAALRRRGCYPSCG